MKNPPFSNNQTFSLAAKPPFYFEGMTTRVFPLRASLYQQQRFADAYLNQVVPKEIGRFQAFMPYVLLMIIDYGKMAATATNLGWVSQREFMFSVPLLWYRVVDGRWQFHDWATSTPFIYVDDELSMTLGRTAYGWPKSLAWLAPGLDQWIKDPLIEPRAAALSTMVFPEVYAGKRQQPREFLEIHESPPPMPLDFPQDPLNPFMPWSILKNLVRSSTGLIGDGVSLLSSLGLTRKRRGASPDNFRRMAERAAELGNLYEMETAFNTVNLKQFRRSEKPSEFCYQALTNAQMKLTSFNRGGLLGDLHVLAGDASGGYAIDLHRWSSLPIIETLGIQVDEEWQGKGPRVSRIRPVLPFWYEVNMDYDVGRTECWRTPDIPWSDRRGRIIQRSLDPKKAPPPTFCTALGASGQAVAGPFRFPSTTLRVLPLLAQRKQLEAFLDGYLNEPLSSADSSDPAKSAGLRFSLWGPSDPDEPHAYVYLVAINYEEMSSATNNIGWWAERELFFCVPVKVEQQNEDGEWELRTLGLVPTFSYANSTTAAIARSEVIGVATTKADIDSPANVWMDDRGPAHDKPQMLLTMSSEVLPVIGEGQKTQTQVILDILEGDVLGDPSDVRWRAVGENWGTVLKHELERKKWSAQRHDRENSNLRALSLEVLANRFPINFFTMKQYRDIADPDRACYQSVVQIQRTFEEVLEIREIEAPCHVRIHQFPSQPFVDALGLVVKLSRDDKGGVVHCLQPIRPFWMKVSLAEDLGQRLMFRAGTETWSEPTLVDPYFLNPKKSPKPDDDARARPQVSLGLVEHLRNSDPVRLRTHAREWRELVAQSGAKRDRPKDSKDLTLESARKAVATIDPQIVIETILSREWESWTPRARWRKSRAEMVGRLDLLRIGASSQEVVTGELDFFRKTLANIKLLYRRPQIPRDLQENLDILEQIGEGTKELEKVFSNIGKATNSREFRAAADVFLFHVTMIVSSDRFTNRFEKYGLEGILDSIMRTRTALVDTGGPEGELAPSRQDAQDADATWLAFKNGDPSSQLRNLVQSVRDIHDFCREHVINRLAKASQKPPFCVPRMCVGPEVDRVFPRKLSWDDAWYVGDIHDDSEKLKAEAAARGEEFSEPASFMEP